MSKKRRFPPLLFLVALALRFVLMAIGFHGDLYSVYWRAHEVVYHGLSIEHNQLLAHALHIVWLWFLKILCLVPESLWVHPFDYGLGWRTLAVHPNAWALLVLLKLPYLVAELYALRVLLTIIPSESRRSVTLYWLFNPLILYGVHLYGRYESFPVLLVILTLAALKNDRPILGLVALVASMLVRFYTAMLLPFYIWLVPSNTKERLHLVATVVLPLAAVLGLQLLLSSSLIAFRDSAELLSLLTMPHRLYLFAAYVPLLQADVIYIFLLGLFFLYLASIDAKRPAQANEIWRWGTWATYWFFATTYFHPQWLVWAVPFLAIQRAVRKRVGPLTWVIALCMVFYTFQFDREVSVLLFSPLAPESFESWIHPMEFLDRLKLGGVLIGAFRTMLSAIFIYLAWLARSDEPLINTRGRSQPHNHVLQESTPEAKEVAR